MKPKYTRKQVEVECDYCHIKFQKDQSEYVRNTQLGRRNYCSRSCVGKDNIENIPEELRMTYDIGQHSANHRDEYSGLREFIRRVKNRSKESNMTLPYLRGIWDDQRGLCPYSGIQLVLPRDKNNDYIRTASLDRIDSSQGYIEGNVQFTSTAINCMKGVLSHEQTIELCKLIALNYQ